MECKTCVECMEPHDEVRYPWQCMECKTCVECMEPHDEVRYPWQCMVCKTCVECMEPHDEVRYPWQWSIIGRTKAFIAQQRTASKRSVREGYVFSLFVCPSLGRTSCSGPVLVAPVRGEGALAK